MFILSFDYGYKYLGIAIGQVFFQTATPLKCLSLRYGNPNWVQIQNIFSSWDCQKVIIGISRSKLFKFNWINKFIYKFANRIYNRFGKNIIFVDEHFTTCEAKILYSRYKEYFYRFNITHNIHAISASLLLIRWYDSLK